MHDFLIGTLCFLVIIAVMSIPMFLKDITHEGIVKNLEIKRGALTEDVYEIELEDGTVFEHPLDNSIQKGSRYVFYRNPIYWGMNGIRKL